MFPCRRLHSANDRWVHAGRMFAAGCDARAAASFVLVMLVPLPAGADDADRLAMPARGVVRPVDQATISTDLQARVAAIGFKEGARFKAGDVLVEFDCRRHRAELAAADAQRREVELALENNLVLNDHRAIGKHEVEISRARVAKAKGEADSLRARVEDCRILAPFDGRVADISIHVFETPANGKPIIRVIDDRQLEIELIVPSAWLSWLRNDMPFDFVVDELKRPLAARVVAIGAAVDPISQTVKIVGRFAEGVDVGDVLAGMSGSAEFAEFKG